MVFNRNGLPIGQIVLPDRDKGRNLKSTSLAIRPGHHELFIVTNSGTEPGGAMVFRSDAFAPAPLPFSHQSPGMSGLGDPATPGQGRALTVLYC